jgi:MFS family permease
LGFATGPLIFAPLSEIYGRQIIFVISFGAFTAFNAGCAGSNNTGTLLVLRFFAGAFGSSPLTNAGGVIADIFPASQRGLAMGLFALAPSFGPCASPWIAGFLSEADGGGWRWVMGLLAIFSGVLWILGTLFVPETYAPVILRKRVAVLKQKTGKEYILQGDKEKGTPSLTSVLATALVRPWILLFMEPIVLLLSIYIAIVYGKFHDLGIIIILTQFRNPLPSLRRFPHCLPTDPRLVRRHRWPPISRCRRWYGHRNCLCRLGEQVVHCSS